VILTLASTPICNQQVVGSNPSAGSLTLRDLHRTTTRAAAREEGDAAEQHSGRAGLGDDGQQDGGVDRIDRDERAGMGREERGVDLETVVDQRAAVVEERVRRAESARAAELGDEEGAVEGQVTVNDGEVVDAAAGDRVAEREFEARRRAWVEAQAAGRKRTGANAGGERAASVDPHRRADRAGAAERAGAVGGHASRAG